MKKMIAGLAMMLVGTAQFVGAAGIEPMAGGQKAIVVEGSDTAVAGKRLRVEVKTEKGSYNVNEPISFVAKTTRDAYLYLYNVTDSNKIIQIFPNRYETVNKVQANTRVSFPKTSKISGDSPGREKFILIATAAKLTVPTHDFGDQYFEMDRNDMEGLRKSIVLEGPSGGFSPAPSAEKERVLKEFEVVINGEGSGFIGDEVFSAPAAARPLVLVTTDKYRYRLNEKVTFGYAADTSGYLKIYQVSPERKRTLVTEARVEPGKVYSWSGKAGAPAGNYALVAVFSKNQADDNFGNDGFMKSIEIMPGHSKGLVPLDTPEIFTVHRFEIE